jgi:4-aminobutyrate aminotransferase-like enzyme
VLSFASDYTEGAHPKLLQHLMERNLVTLAGYGLDPDTEAAKQKINAACGRSDLQICFLTGGTQTNRIAISNARIISTSDKHVVFKYHDYRAGYASKQMRLTHEEFIRRFLLHILPRRFQKIRYYGYLANPVRRKKLRLLFELQGRQKYKAKFSKDTPADVLLNEFLKIDVHKCPKCGKSSMRYIGRNFDLRE